MNTHGWHLNECRRGDSEMIDFEVYSSLHLRGVDCFSWGASTNYFVVFVDFLEVPLDEKKTSCDLN